MSDVNHPSHYTSHASGVECIDITEHMGFNLGNATKYIWRADLKGNAIQDLEKAKWYVEREIKRRKTMSATKYEQGGVMTGSPEIYLRPTPGGVKTTRFRYDRASEPPSIWKESNQDT